MDYDMGFWRQWALYIHQHGLSNAYNGPINYMPAFVYGLYVFDWLQGTDANIIHNINYIKVLFVCFDFLPLVVLCGFRQKILSFKIPHLFLLLNVAYVFNSMVWGQMDSIYVSFAFLALVVSVAYPVPGMLLYLLALNSKQQAIVLAPVIALVLSYSIRDLKTLLTGIVCCAALELLILLPFFNTGGVAKLGLIVSNTVGLYHNLSISAFNIWYMIARGNPYFIVDTDPYIGLSYRTYGLAMFTIAAIAVLLPLGRTILAARKANAPFTSGTYRILFLGAGLLCLSFFYFNTQMHERYAQPVIILFFFYAVVSGNYKLYILASIPYILSLDKAFSFPDGYLPIVHYKIIFASKIIAIWYTATIAYAAYLYRKETRPRGLDPAA
jgi:hypothetical protein